jgi:hypothetical protein
MGVPNRAPNSRRCACRVWWFFARYKKNVWPTPNQARAQIPRICARRCKRPPYFGRPLISGSRADPAAVMSEALRLFARDLSDSHAHAYKPPARRRHLCRGLVVQRYRTVLFVGMSLLFCLSDPLILSHTGKGFNQCWMGKVLYGRKPLSSPRSAEAGGPVAQG